MANAPYDYDYIDYDDYKPFEIREWEKKFDDAADFVAALADELTGDKPIDLNAVNWYLEEICHKMNVRYPRTNELKAVI